MSNSSAIARLPALSLAVVAVGAALSSLVQMNLIFIVKNSGCGPLAAVPDIREANLPVLFALYVALICGAITIFLGVRSSLKNIPMPPAWWLVIGTVIGLSPVLELWIAESKLIKALFAPRLMPDLVPGIDLVFPYLLLVFGGGLVIATLCLASLGLRTRTEAKQKWSFVAAAVLLETALVIATTAFQLRNAWLYKLNSRGY